MTNILKPCPKSDCKAPITHWHGIGGEVDACNFALNGNPCIHVAAGDHRCYAPRVQTEPQNPLILPDVDTVARVIYESRYDDPQWDDESEGLKDVYRVRAQAALDLITSCQPVWKLVEPGANVEKGQRYRIECPNGDAYEFTAFEPWSVQNDGTTIYVLRTPDAPEDPRVEVLAEEMEAECSHCYDEWPCCGVERFRGAARRVIARLDALTEGDNHE